jgi:hypothetical protein
MANEKNEFEGLEENEFDTPKQEFSGVKNDEGSSMISSGAAGEVYDWRTAPEGTKAPPRVSLNKQEVLVTKAQIILPNADKPWLKTRKGDKDYKSCMFEITYSVGGQREYYSGIRIFKREENKYSHPTITRDRVNQASELLGIYADFKKRDINEISLKEFMNFLNSKPKCIIKTVEIKNPINGEKINKNLIEKFI